MTPIFGRGEAWLYGSWARGDPAVDSDVDVLLVGNPTGIRFDELDLPPGPKSVSHYTWSEIDHMVSYGSLFLHHIKQEGHRLTGTAREKGLDVRLQRLGPYQKAERDMRSFRHTVRDVETSLQEDPSALFEMSVLATVIRHASILACYLSGSQSFARETPIRITAGWLGWDDEIVTDACRLYLFRLAGSGICQPPETPSIPLVRTWLQRADSLLDLLGRKSDDREPFSATA